MNNNSAFTGIPNIVISTTFDPFLNFTQEITNSGAARVIETLSNILKQNVMLEVPFINIFQKKENCEIKDKIARKIEQSDVNIVYKIKGVLNGFLIFHFNKEEISYLENHAFKHLKLHEKTDLLSELVNITVSNYFADIANILDGEINLKEHTLETDNIIEALMDFFPERSELVSFINYFYAEEKYNIGSYSVILEKNNFNKLIEKQKITRILMVDDIAFERMNTKKYIFSKMPKVIVDDAKNGLEAIELYKKNKYDLVLMDIAMPLCDGISAVKSIIEYDPKAKIIMLTSLTNNYTVVESIKSGAKDFISKHNYSERFYGSLKKYINSNNPNNHKINCWQYKKCQREGGGLKSNELGICPAFLQEINNGIHGGINGGRSCWAIAGTFCGGTRNGSFAEKIPTCLTCDFYNFVKEEEGEDFFPSFVIKKIADDKK